MMQFSPFSVPLFFSPPSFFVFSCSYPQDHSMKNVALYMVYIALDPDHTVNIEVLDYDPDSDPEYI